jgi:FecR protein
MARRLWFMAILVLSLGPAYVKASTEPEIGTTVAVKNQVTIEAEAQKRKLEKGGKVHQQEIVETAKSASAEIRLLDDTKLAVGPSARLVLDKFVYDASAQPGSITVNLTKGAFRFITGKSTSSAYEIRTPTASMGVRGTVFDVYVAENGETAVLLHEGAVNVCPTPATCRLHNAIGQFVHVNLQGLASLPLRWDGSFMRGVALGSAFPFVGKTLAIDPVRRLRQADLLSPVNRATRGLTKPVESIPRQFQKTIPKGLPF